MSGLAIKNISPVNYDDVFPTIQWFFNNVLKPLDIKLDSICVIGSTGKKDKSGDLDIAIEYPSASKITKDKNVLADLIVKQAENLGLQTNNRIRTGFSMVHIGLPIISNNIDTGKICQLDLMFVLDLEYAQFKYHAPAQDESNYNGAIRSMLLNAFLKEASLKPSYNSCAEDKEPYIVNGECVSPYIKYSFFALGPEQIQLNVKTFRGKKGNFLKTPRKIADESRDCGCMVSILISKLFAESVNGFCPKNSDVHILCNSFENLWNAIVRVDFKNSSVKDRIVKTFIRLFNGANSWQYIDKKLSLPTEILNYAKEHDIKIDDSTSAD